MVPVISAKGTNDCTEDEYFEALIFSSFFIFQKFAPLDYDKREMIMTMIFLGLAQYYASREKLEGIFDNETIIPFLHRRYKTILEEITKKNENPDYDVPLIIYNLYYNPLNKEEQTAQQVKQRNENLTLEYYADVFRNKYYDFRLYLKEILPVIE